MKRFGIIIVVFLVLFQFPACQKRHEDTEKREIDKANEERVVSKKEDSKKMVTKSASLESIKINLETIGSYIRSYKSDAKYESVDYIKEVFEKYGYETEIQKFDIKRPEPLSAMSGKSPEEMFDIVSEDREILGNGENIIVRHPENTDEKKTIYITAHYDTTDTTTGVIDNGTGVAVVLETAKVVRQIQSNINVVFVLFDGEEVGQQGARNFVYNLSEREKQNAIGCINIDMVGEKGAGDMVMKFGNGEHNILSVLWNHILETDMTVEMGVMTDELAFYYGRLPGITIENHNPDFSLDDAENQLQYVDYEQLLDLTNELVDFIRKFDLGFYENALAEKLEVESNLERVCGIENADFKRATARVVENGFLMESCFYYETYDKHEFQIILRNGIFFKEENIDAFQQISDGEKSISFKVESLEEGRVQAIFYNEQYYGIIKGDIGEERCVQIVESFYKAEYW